MTQSASPASARLLVLAAALFFSTGGAAIKACSMTAWQVAGLRSGIAALTLFLLLPAARRGWSWRAVGVGCVYASCLTLFSISNKLTTAANTIFLQSSAPLYILLLGPWLLREPVRRRDVVMMAAMAVGLGFFFVGTPEPSTTAPQPLLGDLLAVASGVAWAGTIVGLRGVGRIRPAVDLGAGGDDATPGEDAAGSAREGNAIPAVVCGNAIAFLVSLPFALPIETRAPIDWALISYLGVFQIGAAYICMTLGLRRVSALEASLLLMLEPVLSPVWAFAFQGEVPGPWSIAGGGLILVATVANARR